MASGAEDNARVQDTIRRRQRDNPPCVCGERQKSHIMGTGRCTGRLCDCREFKEAER